MTNARKFSWKTLLVAGFALTFAVLCSDAHAGKYSVLHTFSGGNDGLYPYAGLTADGKGNIYGTTIFGGNGNPAGCNYGCGTVFKVKPDGTESVLYAFQSWAGQDGNDGALPESVLTVDSAGNLYGTTFSGGSDPYLGTVFKLTPQGNETILHSFTGGDDGASPETGVTVDQAGSLYGTTSEGGGACNCGTVFKLAPDGTETILYSFKGGRHDPAPSSNLVLDQNGNLYGTTLLGGMVHSYCGAGCGTVFKISPQGRKTTVHLFSGKRGDGYWPSGLIAGRDGNFYGTTKGGGTCCGTVFRVTASDTVEIVHSFEGSPKADAPNSSLTEDTDGNLYGTTSGGGIKHNGTVYELTAAREERILHAFDAYLINTSPLAFGRKGSLYGTTMGNQMYGGGVLFRVKY